MPEIPDGIALPARPFTNYNLLSKLQTATICAEQQPEVQRVHDAPLDAPRVEGRHLHKGASDAHGSTSPANLT